jgi:pimeloyl-ACP methyl ester carboxylesterase
VYPVTLRGHGVRRAESGPHLTLDDHVADVAAVVEGEGLDGVTLVGHSYGGRVITRAWPGIASRVERMIYLDAHAPLGPAGAANGSVPFAVDEDGMIPFAEFVPDPTIFGGAEGAAAFFDRLARQSARTLTTPFRVELPAALDKTYVFATAEPSEQFRPYAEAARRNPSWRYVEVPATHWLMYSHPREVATIILDPERA